MNVEQVREYTLSIFGVTEDQPFGDDIITYRIDVDPELKISKTQLLDAILREMSTEGFNETAQSDFGDEMTNLQKAKIIR